MACVQYSKDCDKVRINSVRALGIFLHHLPKEFMGNFISLFYHIDISFFPGLGIKLGKR